MSVISFASLKGGVGKTSLSINVSAALANRGCEVLVIDCDPSSHASRFFSLSQSTRPVQEAPLARLFLGSDNVGAIEDDDSLLDVALKNQIPLLHQVRDNFSLLPGGAEVRHFLWGPGGRAFKRLFPRLIAELQEDYDYIIVDTAPDWNVVTRNVIAASDLVVVPVDSSEMSVYCLEEIIGCAAHIQRPSWCILRSMINSRASQVARLAETRLAENLEEINNNEQIQELGGLMGEDLERSADEFMELVESCDQRKSFTAPQNDSVSTDEPAQESPIYLLNSVVTRTEQQNKLSFTGKTAFEVRPAKRLAEQYVAVAREIEEMLAISNEDSDDNTEEFFSQHLQGAA